MKPFYLILFIAIITGCSFGKKAPVVTQQDVTHVNGVGKVEPEAQIIDLAPESGGKVIEILVDENDSVSNGTPLLTLSNQSEKNNIAVVKAQIESQRAEIQAKKADMQQAALLAENAYNEYMRIEKLYNEGAETGQVRDNALTDWKSKDAAMKSALNEINSQNAKLEELNQTLRLQHSQLDKRFIVAPTDGVILSIDTQPGAYIAEGTSVIQFQPASQAIVRCEIDEMFADKIRNGQQAIILSAGGIDTVGQGEVIFTGKYLKKKSLFYEKAGEAEDRRVMEVKILPDKELPLLLNSKVECAILTSSN